MASLCTALHKLSAEHELRQLRIGFDDQQRGPLPPGIEWLLPALAGMTLKSDATAAAAGAAATASDGGASSSGPSSPSKLRLLHLSNLHAGAIRDWAPALQLPALEDLSLSWFTRPEQPLTCALSADVLGSDPAAGLVLPAARSLRKLELRGRLDASSSFVALSFLPELEEVVLGLAKTDWRGGGGVGPGQEGAIGCPAGVVDSWARSWTRIHSLVLDKVQLGLDVSSCAENMRGLAQMRTSLRSLNLMDQRSFDPSSLKHLAKLDQLEKLVLHEVDEWPVLHRREEEEEEPTSLPQQIAEAEAAPEPMDIDGATDAAAASFAAAASLSTHGSSSSNDGRNKDVGADGVVLDLVSALRGWTRLRVFDLEMTPLSVDAAVDWTVSHSGRPKGQRSYQRDNQREELELARMRHALRQALLDPRDEARRRAGGVAATGAADVGEEAAHPPPPAPLCIRFCKARFTSSRLRSNQDVADVAGSLPLPVADVPQAGGMVNRRGRASVPAGSAAASAAELAQQLALVAQDERMLQEEEEAEQQALLDKMAAAEKGKGKKGKKGRK
jgi:hypothetical protein